MPLGLWQLKLIAAYYSTDVVTALGESNQGKVTETERQRLISDELLESAINATQQWLYDWLRGKCFFNFSLS